MLGFIKPKHSTMFGKLLKKFRVGRAQGNYERLLKDEAYKPSRAKSGHVVIYVGSEAKRYEVPVAHLSYPEVVQMMRGSLGEARLDIEIIGPIHLECSPEEFEAVLHHANLSKKANHIRFQDTAKPPTRAKRGHVAIYVGLDLARRYEVPVKYLSFYEIVQLMKEANGDGLDIKITGPLHIRCSPEEFENVLHRAKGF